MPLTVPDLLQPIGEIEKNLITNEAETTARVTVWLGQGNARADAAGLTGDTKDEAAAAWVYHRAFKTKAALMGQQAASASLDDMSRTYAADQRKFFDGLATQWEATYQGLITPIASPSRASKRLGSYSIPTQTVL